MQKFFGLISKVLTSDFFVAIKFIIPILFLLFVVLPYMFLYGPRIVEAWKQYNEFVSTEETEEGK